MRTTTFSLIDHVPASVREFPKRRAAEIGGLVALAGVASLTLALLTWSVSDPSLNHATNARVHNLLGAPGAIAADLVMQFLGLASAALMAPPAFWGWSLITKRRLERPRLKAGLYLTGVIATAGLASLLPAPGSWPLPTGLGGVVGDAVLALPHRLLPASPWATIALGCSLAAIAILSLAAASGVGGSPSSPEDAADNSVGKARAGRWRASTTKTTRTNQALAWCRSALSFMPCSRRKQRCAGWPLAARGKRPPLRLSSILGRLPRRPRPGRVSVKPTTFRPLPPPSRLALRPSWLPLP